MGFFARRRKRKGAAAVKPPDQNGQSDFGELEERQEAVFPFVLILRCMSPVL
jgi:hypothetical protein